MPPIFMIHPRYRNTDSETPTTWRKTITGVNYPSMDATYPSMVEFERKSIGDQTNGRWRKKQRAGNLILSPMTLIKSSRSSGGVMEPMVVNASWSGGSRVTVFQGDFSSSGFENNINSLFIPVDLEKDLPSMGSIALVKAMAKVNGSDMLIGEGMADFTKSVMMLRRPFKGATDLVSRMVKSRSSSLKRSGSNLAQASADCWLEYRYGWKPLILDGKTVVDYALKERHKFLGNARVARAEERRVSNVTTPFSFGATTDPKWNRAGTASRKQTARACSGIVYRLNDFTENDRLARLLGSRVCDIPSTIWETIPFSFVLDWFTNVGTWIRASVPDPQVQILGQWVTSIYKSETRVESCTFTYSEYVDQDHYASGSSRMNTPHWTNEWVQRNVNPTMPEWPAASIKLTWPNTLTALALSSQQLVQKISSFKH